MTSRHSSKRIRRSTNEPTEPANDSPDNHNISLIDSVNETSPSNNTANSTIESLKKGLTRNLNLATTVAKEIDEMEKRHLDEINRMKQAHQTDLNELRRRLCVCEKCHISNDVIRRCKGCMRTSKT
ncbi:uncharacterized protein LOC119073904 [Bradysia coprophila]|uniref:uncharacterized protein LOC119073904 n=1 Tax=Bradysia coprophila TaxID=38358 RepID=UPI00187DD427|nr:uncharacterized protein LOC119073904 [Bradysia coprophila]